MKSQTGKQLRKINGAKASSAKRLTKLITSSKTDKAKREDKNHQYQE